LLLSDDVSMGALSGTIGERSKAAIAAGCDVVLHCNGKLDEMQEVAGNVPNLAGDAAARAVNALAARETPSEFDAIAGRRVFEDMLAPVWNPAEAAA
jgi:beta-N-acetylhexosaminidase